MYMCSAREVSKTGLCYVGSEILRAVMMKSCIFWDIMPCNPFACHLLHDGFMLGLLFKLGDRGNIFLQNTGWLAMDYTALPPRGQNFSWPWNCSFQDLLFLTALPSFPSVLFIITFYTEHVNVHLILIPFHWAGLQPFLSISASDVQMHLNLMSLLFCRHLRTDIPPLFLLSTNDADMHLQSTYCPIMTHKDWPSFSLF